MINTLIIYEGKYGTCKKVAEIMGYIIGNINICTPETAPKKLGLYDNVIFIFGFYGYETLIHTTKYLDIMKEQLLDKKIVIIGVGLAKFDLQNYSKKITDILVRRENISAFIHGELRLDKISQKDRDDLELFSKKVGMEIKDMGELKVKEVVEVGAIIADKIKQPKIKINDKELIKEIHNFISSHNTLSLATGCDDYIRCTPVEYIYDNDNLYIITEGGMKFKGIMLNKNISFSIYNNYENMSNLSGLQVSGIAEILPLFDDEYEKILKIKGVNIDTVKNLAVNLYIIKIVPSKYEFLCSSFRKKGYSSKQIYDTTLCNV